MQWGRNYRQIRPWGIAENMPVRYRLPVAIFPAFSLLYDNGAIFNFVGEQDQPPHVQLNPGVVQWLGFGTAGPYNYRWILEHLRQDFVEGYKYSLLLNDDQGSVLAQQNNWRIGDNSWDHPFGFTGGVVSQISHQGSIVGGGWYNTSVRHYSQEP